MKKADVQHIQIVHRRVFQQRAVMVHHPHRGRRFRLARQARRHIRIPDARKAHRAVHAVVEGGKAVAVQHIQLVAHPGHHMLPVRRIVRAGPQRKAPFDLPVRLHARQRGAVVVQDVLAKRLNVVAGQGVDAHQARAAAQEADDAVDKQRQHRQRACQQQKQPYGAPRAPHAPPAGRAMARDAAFDVGILS